MTTARARATGAIAHPSDAEEVRALLEAWAGAVRWRDLEGVLARHAEDIVFFDVPPPAQVRGMLGMRGYAASWPPFFEYIGSRGRFDLDDLVVVAGAEVAFAHAMLLVRGHTELATSRVRLTVGLRKRAGEWIITHEHHSAPCDIAPQPEMPS